MKIAVQNIFRSGIFPDLFILVFACTFIAESQTFTLPYHQNFDSVIVPQLPFGWSATSNRSQSGDFKTTSSTVHSLPNAVVDSNATIEQSLFSPQFNFSNTVGDSIIFFERRTATHNAGIILEAAIGSDTTFPFRISDTITNAGTTNYIRRAFALPETLNNQTQVRFRWRVLGNGTGGNVATVRFDDVSLTKKILFDAAISRIVFVPQFPLQGDTLHIIATVKNFGNNAFTNDTVKFYFDANNDSVPQQNELFRAQIITSPVAPNDSVLAEGTFHLASHSVVHFFVQSCLSGEENTENDILSATVAIGVSPHSIAINEIMYKPSSPEPEWVEIFNRFGDSVNLKQWKIADRNIASKHTITTYDYWLKRDSFAVVVKDSESFFEVHPNVPAKIFVTASFPSLNNDSDDVVLFDNRNFIIDSIPYKFSWGGGSGKSLERIFADSSSVVFSNFGSCAESTASTPGKINSLTPRNIDAAITQCNVTPQMPFPGSPVTIATTIKNAGKNSFTNVSLKLFYDRNFDSVALPDEQFYQQFVTNTLNFRDSVIIETPFDSIHNGRNQFIATVALAGDERSENNSIVASVNSLHQAHTVLVNEIMYAPSADEPEWVELLNMTDDSIHLMNWKIGDATTIVTITSSQKVIPPRKYAIITKDSLAFSAIHLLDSTLLIETTQLPSFNNNSDGVIVRDENNIVMDSLYYFSSWGGGSGISLERIFVDSFSNTALNWGSCRDTNKSTPGKNNSLSPKNIDGAIEQIRFLPSAPEPGNVVTITALIKNVGKNSLTNFTALFYFDSNGDSIAQEAEKFSEQVISSVLQFRDTINVSAVFDSIQNGLNQFIVIIEISGDEVVQNNYRIGSIKSLHAERSILVNEIMYAPSADEPEWVELLNNTNDSMDLKQWKIGDAITSVFITQQRKIVPPKHFVIITKDSLAFTIFHPNTAELIIGVSQFPSLNNNADAVILRDEFGIISDSLYFLALWGGGTGISLERIFADSSSLFSANWGSSEDSAGSTPGQKNSLTPRNIDVALFRVDISPLHPLPQTSIFIAALVKNIGINSLSNISVKFFHDANRDSLPQLQELFDTQVISSVLVYGDSILLQTQFNNISAGVNNFIVVAEISGDERLANNSLRASIHTATLPQSVIVNEIMYAPTGDEPEWVELYNNSNDTIDLMNWKISDNITTTKILIAPQTQILPARSFVVLAKDTLLFSSVHFNIPSMLLQVSQLPSLNNSGDAVVIYDASNAVVDSVHYKQQWGGSTGGKSLERMYVDSLSNDSTNWSSCIDIRKSTPGEKNSIVPHNIDVALDDFSVIPFCADFQPTNPEIFFPFQVINKGIQTCTRFRIDLYNDVNFDSIAQESELCDSITFNTLLAMGDTLMDTIRTQCGVEPGTVQFICKINIEDDERIENNTKINSFKYRRCSTTIINEIMYAPLGDEPEWIELYVHIADSVNLKNWTLSDGATQSTITLSDEILYPGQFVIITKDSSALRTVHNNVNAKIIQPAQFPTLNNSGDAIIIKDEFNVIADSLYYFSTWGGMNGKSLERITIDYYDSGDSLNWGSSTISSTPGVRNSLATYDKDIQVKNIYSTPYISGVSLYAVIENIGTNDVLTSENFSVKFYYDENRDSIAEENELISLQPFSLNLHFKDTLIVHYNWRTSFFGKKQIIAVVEYSEDENLRNDTLVAIISFSFPFNSFVINEIMYEPLAGKSEYIELYNRSNDTIDVERWKISDVRDSSTTNTEFLFTKYPHQIAPYHYVILAADSSFLTQFPHIDTAVAQVFIINKSSLGLNNDEDDIVLCDATHTVIDSVHYSYRWHNPEVITTQGKSLERIHFDISTNDRRNWSTSVANGTPGKLNSIFVAVLPTSASVSCSPNPFSPDGDGREDNTIITYNIPAHAASLRIRIFDVKGRMVRELSHNEPSGAHGEIIWDGRDDDGKIVRIGVYIVFLEAADAFGSNMFTTKGLVVVAGDLR